MSLTNAQLLARIVELETALADQDTAINNVATRKELKNLFAILQGAIDNLTSNVNQLQSVGSSSAPLAAHKVDAGAHIELSDRYFAQSEFRYVSAGVADAYQPVQLSASGVLDPSILPGGSISDHGALGGLSDDDHPQYQTEARANTWLGALPSGTLDHSSLAGLDNDHHTQYFLLGGRSSSQYAYGGTNDSENLYLSSTRGSIKGSIYFGSSSTFNEATTLLGLGTTLPTHTITLPTSATGFASYNTADQTTNFERVLASWVANVWTIRMTKGGTGTSRGIQFLTNDGSGFSISDFGTLSLIGGSGGYGFFQIASDGAGLSLDGKLTSQAGRAAVRLRSNSSSGGMSASSGAVQQVTQVLGTINQTGTAAYTGLEVNLTVTSSGTGNRRIFDGIVGSNSKFYIDASGDTVASGNMSILGQFAPTNTPFIATGAAQTINWNDGNFQMLSLAAGSGNVTLTLVNPLPGGSYVLKVIQRASSPANIVWPVTVKWPSGTAPTISTGANAIDLVSLIWDGTNYFGSVVQNFS